METFPKSSFRLRWTLHCAAGEFLGIAAAAALAVAGNRWIGEPVALGQKGAVLGLALLSGVAEGSVLAGFQWRVLRERFPALPGRRWWRNTVAVAAAGWFLGMLPSLFLTRGEASAAPPPEVPLIVILAGAAAMGLALGALFGWGQWLVLRRYAPRPGRWITLNALGWTAGMVFIFLAATLPDEHTPAGWIIAGGCLGGCLAGLAVGAATSRFF